ncbi:MAG: hypothetical protein R6V06_06350 [Kiritimatiellia bacterium]
MNVQQKNYKWVRLVTGGVIPLILSLVFVIAFALLNEGWEPAGRLAGICRELTQGTTEGRQALAGSCWNGPLPTLFYLPIAWIFPIKAAGYISFFLAFFVMLWSVREALKGSVHAFTHITAAQTGIAVIAFTLDPEVLTVSTVLPVAFFAITFGSLLDWSARMWLRDIVMIGAGVAMLSISGIHFFSLAVWFAVAVPYIWFWHRQGEKFARTVSAAVVGWLPWIYSLATWFLLNWLIMGDPFFFLRSLVRYSETAGFVFLITLLIPALLIIGYLKLGIVFLRSNVDEVASRNGNRVFSFIVVLSSGVYLYGLVCSGLTWCFFELLLSVFMLLLIFFVRFFDNRALIVISMVICIALSILFQSKVGFSAAKQLDVAERRSLRREVERYVDSETRYGRVFVPGYTGLTLLQDYDGDCLTPNLHFHVNTLRKDYFGQDLYVLVPRPEGFTAMEYIFAAYPGIYDYGCERLLFAGAFGDWHLFQVVSAPTWRELDAGKK